MLTLDQKKELQEIVRKGEMLDNALREQRDAILERLWEFAKFDGYTSKASFLRHLAIDQGLYTPKRKKSKLYVKTICKINRTYPELSLNWLVYGNGSMLTDHPVDFNLCTERVNNARDLLKKDKDQVKSDPKPASVAPVTVQTVKVLDAKAAPVSQKQVEFLLKFTSLVGEYVELPPEEIAKYSYPLMLKIKA